MPSVPSTSAQQQQHQQQLSLQQHNQVHQQQIATIETPPTGSTNMPIPIVTCDFASDISTSEAAECETQQTTQQPQANSKETLKVGLVVQQTNSTGGRATAATNGTSTNELQVSPVQGRCRALSVGIDTDMVSEFDPSSSDSGVISRCAVVKPLKFRLCQPIFGRKNQRRNESKALKNSTKPSEPASSELEPAIPKVQKPRDPEKEKRRIARKKEKRATLILGLIMGSFIACWLPFFFLYILTPACTKCKIPQSAFAVAFWLGYMNSALNPAIYTIFNKDFRRAFRRILFK
ncbi:unnamed protein product [Hermetia illucens]|uniref:G-protein coupled receptors family 1 profile domain-containing protein n=1 Tax=Hermetia illucens TaxID=343691 RepID=A0A7R8UQ75_HERIL|nr:unnamed protein product [Hermetia illucens]